MCRHIVGALHRMVIIWFVFRGETVEDLIHIASDVGVGVFVHGQSTRSVPDENVDKACRGQLRQMTENLGGYQMAPSSAGSEAEFILLDHP